MKLNNWHLYSDNKSIVSSSPVSLQIIECLSNISIELRIGRETEELTNEIKFSLIKLGYENGNCVYACLKKSKSKSNASKIDERSAQLLEEINKIVDHNRLKFKFGKHIFRNHEWLFDIHWYKDKTHYTPRKLSLVAESELSKNRRNDSSDSPYSAVKFDFQKLLVSNAELRLLIFRISNIKHLASNEESLASYFESAIKAYKQLSIGSKFLLICYVGETVYYKELSKI